MGICFRDKRINYERECHSEVISAHGMLSSCFHSVMPFPFPGHSLCDYYSNVEVLPSVLPKFRMFLVSVM